MTQAKPHQARPAAAAGNGWFENPYNFVPAWPREQLQGELADRAPVGHHRYLPGYYSGRVRLRLTTATPLLIQREARTQGEHKVFTVRTDADGAPLLPPTSLKGALRAAYEAITNSRLGVFTGHTARLAFRNPARGDMKLLPARVSDDGRSFELFPGMEDGSQPAAWVPAPYHKQIGQLLQQGGPVGASKHGQFVRAWVELWEHYRCTKPQNGSARWQKDFTFWRVVGLGDNPHPPQPSPMRELPNADQNQNQQNKRTFARPMPKVELQKVEGWLCINGQNMPNKHDERLFFRKPGATTRTLPMTDEIVQQWQELITDYRLANKRELDKGARHPSALKYGQYSRHILGASEHVEDNNLRPGTLCYLKVDDPQSPTRVEAIYPVLISRELYAASPRSLLPASLWPAGRLAELSPADRVFGWVHAHGQGAYKGQLRIGPVRCLQGAEAIERVGGGDGVPLAVLSTPKPAQARFYGARDRTGTPYEPRVAKAQTYQPDHGLRGRKFYPHQAQAMLEGYWQARARAEEPLAQRLEGVAVYREWLHPTGARSDQNRSLLAWVRPGTQFECDLDLINLSAVELGALLWLLNLPADCHLRLGGGKPLGFGSVRVEIVALDLCDGEAIAADYRAFGGAVQSGRRIRTLDEAADLIRAYQQAFLEAYPQPTQTSSTVAASEQGPFAALASLKGRVRTAQASTLDPEAFDAHPIIRAFLHAARGGRLPVHYPRRTPQPVEGKNYEWFVENERVEQGQIKHGHALPALWQERRALPLKPLLNERTLS